MEPEKWIQISWNGKQSFSDSMVVLGGVMFQTFHGE